MRIDDTDPDELDGAQLSRRRKWIIAGSVVALAGAGAITFATLNGDDDAVVATSTRPETTVVDTEPDGRGGGFVPAEVGFPDSFSDYMGEKLEVLYQRTTPDGIAITVQDTGDWNVVFNDGFGAGADPATAAPTAETTAAAAGDVVEVVAVTDTVSSVVPVEEPRPIAPPPTGVPNGWQPAKWCNATGGYRVALSYKDSIGVANGARYDEPRDGLAVTMFTSGYAEDNPFRVLVMQVADDVVNVAVTWNDGSADAAAPVKGWVALAVPGEPSGVFTLTVKTVEGERKVDWQDIAREGDIEWQKACQPPPPGLPEPGIEQPDDPDAAADEIRAAFDLLWNLDVPFAEKGAQVLDDTEGVEAAIEQVMNGGFGETAKTAVHTITDLVFVSPDEAWFQYDLETDTVDFTGRFGVAYRSDGTWKIARAVICQDLSLAGGQCQPFVDSVQPPGAFAPGPIPID